MDLASLGLHRPELLLPIGHRRDGSPIFPIAGGSNVTGTLAELIYVNTASGTAKASFTSEFTINDTAGMGPYAELPPYFWKDGPYGTGKTIRIVARGIVASTGTPTYLFSLRLGAAASTSAAIILGSAAITTGSGVSAQLWEFQGDVVMRTMGAAGANSTVQGLGSIISGGGFAAPYHYALFGGAASPGTVATVDTSITNYLSFNVTCSASSSSNTITLLQLMVLGLN